jgi:hypothetical protein
MMSLGHASIGHAVSPNLPIRPILLGPAGFDGFASSQPDPDLLPIIGVRNPFIGP